MDDKKLIKELNKILTLEHGHLGMYKNYMDYDDKEIRHAFRRFMEVEEEHIAKISNIIRNLGGKPSLTVDGGDIIGKFFGVALNTVAGTKELLKAYRFIEKKSHEGYAKFVSQLEQDGRERNKFIAEIAAANMLEAQLMQLWLDNKLQTFGVQQN